MNSIELMERLMAEYPDVSEDTKNYVRTKIQEAEDKIIVERFVKVIMDNG